MRNKCLLFKPHSLWCLLRSLSGLIHLVFPFSGLGLWGHHWPRLDTVAPLAANCRLACPVFLVYTARGISSQSPLMAWKLRPRAHWQRQEGSFQGSPGWTWGPCHQVGAGRAASTLLGTSLSPTKWAVEVSASGPPFTPGRCDLLTKRALAIRPLPHSCTLAVLLAFCGKQ